MPGPSGLNGECPGPRKPTVPGSDHGTCLVRSARPTNGGTDGSTGPFTLERTAPRLGLPPIVDSEACGQPDMHITASWRSGAPTTERITTHLSMRAAMRGKTSQIWMPVTLVWIGLNSPRISLGASVL